MEPAAVATQIARLERAVRSAGPQERQRLTVTFWEGPGSRSPIVEEPREGSATLRVTFLWRDADAHAVLLEANRLTASVADSVMHRVAGTDVWYRTFDLESAWRGSYTLLPLDRAGFTEINCMDPRWAMRTVRERGSLDPRNPEMTYTFAGCASVAALPGATPQPWLELSTTVSGETAPARTPEGRRAWVHRPPGADAAGRPLVLVLDGQAWQRSGYAARQIDALAAAGVIRVPDLVLVDTGDAEQRKAECGIDGGLSAELVESVLPWARERLGSSTDRADIIVTGESLGGLTALKTAFEHSDRVGKVLSQSASLWQDGLVGRAERAVEPLRIVTTVGSAEGRLLEPHRALGRALAELPHSHRAIEFAGGHDMAWWRGLWAEGLRGLLDLTQER
ncbi:MAG: enterochelin esterase domain-containing protein [Leucobacter sp.]